MLHAFFSQLFDDLMWATAIWTALLTLAMLVAALLVIQAHERDRVTVVDTKHLAAQAEDLHRYSRVVTIAAQRAAAMARRRREEWLAAQAQAEAAWQQYEKGDAATQRLNQAAAYPVRRMRASRAERERYLHRAAMTRCSHRQLSALDLSDVLAHRNGWSPERHPVEQEIALQRAVRDSLFTAYRAAAERERKAWQDADVAAAASTSLRAEAIVAASRARNVQFGLACATGFKGTRRTGQFSLLAGASTILTGRSPARTRRRGSRTASPHPRPVGSWSPTRS